MSIKELCGFFAVLSILSFISLIVSLIIHISTGNCCKEYNNTQCCIDYEESYTSSWISFSLLIVFIFLHLLNMDNWIYKKCCQKNNILPVSN